MKTRLFSSDDLALIEAHGLTAEVLERFHFAALKSSRLVFVDGHFAAELSTFLPMPAGVQVLSLSAAIEQDIAGV